MLPSGASDGIASVVMVPWTTLELLATGLDKFCQFAIIIQKKKEEEKRWKNS
ncbi:MAG: hypothetical protein Q8O83_05040 [bacterium]|nr:hypothetical protein [bacterium]